MSNKFYKLKRDGNWYYINNPKGELKFNSMGKFSVEDVRTVFNFAYDMTFGKVGEHRGSRSGGTINRRNGQKFANTFQGKLGECAIYNELCKLASEDTTKFSVAQISKPDYSIGGLGIWDHVDINIGNFTASVKSTKSYGQLLLLETGDWDNNGRYLHSMDKHGNVNPVAYDFNFLVRVKTTHYQASSDKVISSCEDIMKANNLLYTDSISKDILAKLMLKEWFYDIPGFVTHDELVYIIQNKFIIPKDAEYGKKHTKMDAENYYVRAADMSDISQLTAKM